MRREPRAVSGYRHRHSRWSEGSENQVRRILPTAGAILMAVATWIPYLCVHFVLVPGWFAWRSRHSPYALRWLPRNGYDLVESAYGLLVACYTIAILRG